MTRHVRSRRVTFIRPFVLVGLKGVQPSGTYSVETRDERVGFWWFLRANLTSTSIRVCRNPGVAGVLQTVNIDPLNLADALVRDVAPAEMPTDTDAGHKAC
jgi:hypothetical protein